jgi:hypothetical protein
VSAAPFTVANTEKALKAFPSSLAPPSGAFACQKF